MAFTSLTLTKIIIAQSTMWQSLKPNFTKISHNIWKLWVIINLRPLAKYDCHWTNDTHTCL